MSETNASLHLRGVQTADGEKDVTELDVVGVYRRGDKGFTVSYSDYTSSPELNKTVISFSEDTLIMTKLGEISTEMLFKKGMRTNCDYQTPYGSFEIGIYTSELSVSADDASADIRLIYSIDFNYGFAAVNELDIKIIRQGE